MRSFNELLQSPRALKALVATGSLFGLLLLGLVAAPAVVRCRLESAARDRGLEATASGVSCGLGRIWLRGVRVSTPGGEAELELNALSVGIFSGAVRGSGGTLRGSGDPEELLRKLRHGRREGGGGESDAAGRDVSIDGLRVRWRRGAEALEAFGARLQRDRGVLTFGADLVRVEAGSRSVEARGLALGVA